MDPLRQGRRPSARGFFSSTHTPLERGGPVLADRRAAAQAALDADAEEAADDLRRQLQDAWRQALGEFTARERVIDYADVQIYSRPGHGREAFGLARSSLANGSARRYSERSA